MKKALKTLKKGVIVTLFFTITSTILITPIIIYLLCQANQ